MNLSRQPEHNTNTTVHRRTVTIMVFSNGDIAAFENGKQIAEIQAEEIRASDLVRDRVERMGFSVSRIEYQGGTTVYGQ